jgi:hypothetical protein
MLIVRATGENWRDGLITGQGIEKAFADWLASGAYKDRTE